jgi:hypothetical protein
MLGAYFMAQGARFRVDDFLKSWTGKIDSVSHRGEASRLPGRRVACSGFSVTFNKEFGKLSGQIRDAQRFLQNNHANICRLIDYPGVTDVRLVFTYSPSRTRVEYLPPKLIQLAASLHLAVAISVYPD